MDSVDIFGERRHLDSGELLALLAELFGDHEGSLERTDHTIVFCQGQLEVTFKSRTSRVLSVGPKNARTNFRAQHLLRAVDDFLLAEQEQRVSHRVVLASWMSPDDLSEELVFARDASFHVEAARGIEARGRFVGTPCLVSFAYPYSNAHWLDVYRQERRFLCVRDALAALAPGRTPFFFRDPYRDLQKVWVCDSRRNSGEDRVRDNQVAQLGYFWPEPLPIQSVSDLCRTSTLPDLHRVLDMVDRLGGEALSTFHVASSWAHEGAIARRASLRLLCLTTMVESLLEPADTTSCESCGQPQYSVKRRFVDLVTGALGDSRKRWAGQLYDMRSKLAHEGAWVAGEGTARPAAIIPGNNWQDMDVWSLALSASEILEYWMRQRVPDANPAGA